MDLYRELILDHYKNPRNFGHLDKPDVIMEEHNASCGDRIVMEVKLKSAKRVTNGDRIEDIRFHGEGCAISQASASILTEHVMGKSAASVIQLTTHDVLSLLGVTLTPTRVACAVLPLEVLQKAILKKRKGT